MGDMRDYGPKIAKLKEELASWEAKRAEILATGQSWDLRNGDDRRSLQNVSLAEINKMIETTQWKIDQLEGLTEGYGNPSGVRIKAGVL